MDKTLPPLGKITITFSHPSAGCVLMAILLNTRNQHLVIHCSEPFDPFIDLVNWLHQIADGHLPADFEVDEEGRFKRLVAEAVVSKEEEIVFRVEDPWVNEKEQKEGVGIFLQCRLEHRQMLQEFTKRLQQWLEDEYDPLEYGYDNKEEYEEGYGFDLREDINIEKLLTKVNAL